MRTITLFFVGLMASSTAFAQVEDDFGFPVPIDLEVQRTLLSETFPEVDRNLTKIDGLRKYRRDLELYRIGKLEAYNEKIKRVCETLKTVERRVNQSFASGDLSPNEQKNYNRRIASERDKCLVSKKGTSPYWALYDDFLQFYRSESDASKEELDRCYINDDCREGRQ